MNTTTLIIIGAVVLVLILLLLLLRSRKQHVDFSAPAPAPKVAEPAPAPVLAPAPVAPAAPAAAPVPLADAPAPMADAGLTRLKGLGPKAATRLGELGVTSVDQIAAWSDADIARIDAEMGAFKGRIVRDRWVDQAKLLAGGDLDAYEAQFGKLGG